MYGKTFEMDHHSYQKWNVFKKDMVLKINFFEVFNNLKESIFAPMGPT